MILGYDKMLLVFILPYRKMLAIFHATIFFHQDNFLHSGKIINKPDEYSDAVSTL